MKIPLKETLCSKHGNKVCSPHLTKRVPIGGVAYRKTAFKVDGKHLWENCGTGMRKTFTESHRPH